MVHIKVAVLADKFIAFTVVPHMLR